MISKSLMVPHDKLLCLWWQDTNLKVKNELHCSHRHLSVMTCPDQLLYKLLRVSMLIFIAAWMAGSISSLIGTGTMPSNLKILWTMCVNMSSRCRSNAFQISKGPMKVRRCQRVRWVYLQTKYNLCIRISHPLSLGRPFFQNRGTWKNTSFPYLARTSRDKVMVSDYDTLSNGCRSSIFQMKTLT